MTEVFAQDIGVTMRELIKSRSLIVTYKPDRDNVILVEYCGCHPKPVEKHASNTSETKEAVNLRQKFDKFDMVHKIALQVNYL